MGAERRVKELQFQQDEDHKNSDRMSELAGKLQQKIKTYKKQIEEAEEIAALNLANTARPNKNLKRLKIDPRWLALLSLWHMLFKQLWTKTKPLLNKYITKTSNHDWYLVSNFRGGQWSCFIVGKLQQAVFLKYL